jgi:hypothetical protein
MDGIVSLVRTDQMNGTLYIPPSGVLQVFQYEVDPVTLLTGDGRYACLHVGGRTKVHFRISDDAAHNHRATEALYMLSNFNMVFTGPVVITDIEGDRVFQVIQQCSKEGT